MPNSKPHRRVPEVKDRRGRLTEKASSFHGKSLVAMEEAKQLHRPRTAPDLLSGRSFVQPAVQERPRLTKLLLHVNVLGGVGPVQVIISPESTVGELIATAVRQYIKDGRRPILPAADPSSFDLHYSQFSLECLDREEKLISLGSRNFFLCPRKPPAESGAGCSGAATPSSSGSCSREAEKDAKPGFNWLKFMDFLN